MTADKPCTCEAPGLCPLAKFTMTAREHQLCQTRPDYRRLFRSGAAPQHRRERMRNGHPEPTTPETFDCVHRGPLLEAGVCNLCSLKGQKFEKLACALHGACSIHKKHRKVRACIACEDRQPPEPSTH